MGPPSDAADAQLIAAHLAGDRAAFGELVLRYQDRLWAVALRTLRDPDDAADALQDALLSAYRGAAGFRADSRVSTWLHRIVVNACIDKIRRKRPVEPLDQHGPAEPAAPSDAIASRETGMLIADALGRLPEEQRLPIVLVDVQGYPVTEVALMLHLPTGTVKSRCSRGRARLAAELGHLRPDPTAAGRNHTGSAAVPSVTGTKRRSRRGRT